MTLLLNVLDLNSCFMFFFILISLCSLRTYECSADEMSLCDIHTISGLRLSTMIRHFGINIKTYSYSSSEHDLNFCPDDFIEMRNTYVNCAIF